MSVQDTGRRKKGHARGGRGVVGAPFPEPPPPAFRADDGPMGEVEGVLSYPNIYDSK